MLFNFGLNPEQWEQWRELERQEEEFTDLRESMEETHRRNAEEEAKLKALRAFINRRIVRSYLNFMGFPPRDHKGIRDHLREIVAGLDGNSSQSAVERFMEGELQGAGVY
ncbi:MAG: hypothetical protein NTY64_04305 [Deltaproteobacteria bacterium]|nr:hypothetical protein [Deltaproteobacteria bacterium]